MEGDGAKYSVREATMFDSISDCSLSSSENNDETIVVKEHNWSTSLDFRRYG